MGACPLWEILDPPLKWVLESLSDDLPLLNLVCNEADLVLQMNSERFQNKNDELTIIESTKAYANLVECVGPQKHPSLGLLVNDSQGVTELARHPHPCLGSLLLIGVKAEPGCVTENLDIPTCPNLGELSCSQLNIDTSACLTLSESIRLGRLPKLSNLIFGNCCSTLKGNLSKLFESEWPRLTHLNLNGSDLDDSDIKTLALSLVDHKNGMLPKLKSLVLDFGVELDVSDSTSDFASSVYAMFQFPLVNIKALCLHNLTEILHQSLAVAINQDNLPNVTCLGISIVNDIIQGCEMFYAPMTPSVYFSFIRGIYFLFHVDIIDKSKHIFNIKRFS